MKGEGKSSADPLDPKPLTLDLHGPLFISLSTVQQLSQAYGLTLNAVELTSDELLALRYP